MNYMADVAQLLGVEIGEEFKIEGHSGNVKYRLSEENLEYLSGDKAFTISSTLNKLLNGEYKVVKIPKPVLNDVEKEYLSTVIKPFRNRIKCFYKYTCVNKDYEAITATMADLGCLDFPPFKKNTMYKSMEMEKRYSIEELGL